MKTTERVMEFLKQQGFCPEIDPENGNIIFKYQMRTFIFINNDEDESFFQLALPGIVDVTEDNRELVLEACNKTNFGIKVINENIQIEAEILYDIIFKKKAHLQVVVKASNSLSNHERHGNEI